MVVPWASLVAQMVKNLPAMQETQVLSLGWEDPREKGLATYSGILVWRIPWAEAPSRLQSRGSQRVGQEWTSLTPVIVPRSIDCCSFVAGFKTGSYESSDFILLFQDYFDYLEFLAFSCEFYDQLIKFYKKKKGN